MKRQPDHVTNVTPTCEICGDRAAWLLTEPLPDNTTGAHVDQVRLLLCNDHAAVWADPRQLASMANHPTAKPRRRPPVNVECCCGMVLLPPGARVAVDTSRIHTADKCEPLHTRGTQMPGGDAA